MADNRDKVAGIEKAIKEKYGEAAIVNPRSLWDDEKERNYLEQLKKAAVQHYQKTEKPDKVDNGGFFISKKLLNRESERECPVCETYSFDIQDDIYMSKYECCLKCYIQYVENREERWLKGWRPNNGNNT